MARKAKYPIINGYKVCSKCLTEKQISDFYKSSKNVGYKGKCKDCFLSENKEYKRIYRSNAETKEYERNYIQKHRSSPEVKLHIKEVQKKYHSLNKDRYNLLRRTEKYKNKKNEFLKRRYKEDLLYNIQRRYRSRLTAAVTNKSRKSFEYLGCAIDEFKIHLESQFLDGMTWDNRRKWHIDHIQPCCSFDLTKEEEIYKCFHYSNLLPYAEWIILPYGEFIEEPIESSCNGSSGCSITKTYTIPFGTSTKSFK